MGICSSQSKQSTRTSLSPKKQIKYHTETDRKFSYQQNQILSKTLETNSSKRGTTTTVPTPRLNQLSQDPDDLRIILKEEQLFDSYSKKDESQVGESFLIEHKHIGEIRCAHKIVNKISNIDLTIQIKEIQRLEHPNILSIYNLYDYDRETYLVTEACEGPSLQDDRCSLQQKQNKVDIIFYQMLRAVHLIHQNNKLVNINSKTVSFSALAYPLIKLQYFGDILKTVEDSSFYAPEQFRDIYTKESNIWSLGVLFFQYMTGHHSFKTEYDQQARGRILKCDIIENENWKNSNYSDLKNLILSMLQINPYNRPSAEKCLKNQYFKTYCSQLNRANLFKTSLDNISLFTNTQGKLGLMIKYEFIDSMFTKFQRDKVSQAFLALDINCDNSIDQTEVNYHLTKFYEGKLVLGLTNKIFNQIQASNYKINFRQYLLMSCDKEKVFTEQRILQFYTHIFPTLEIFKKDNLTIKEVTNLLLN